VHIKHVFNDPDADHIRIRGCCHRAGEQGDPGGAIPGKNFASLFTRLLAIFRTAAFSERIVLTGRTRRCLRITESPGRGRESRSSRDINLPDFQVISFEIVLCSMKEIG
jgi:hypothetical protein